MTAELRGLAAQSRCRVVPRGLLPNSLARDVVLTGGLLQHVSKETSLRGVGADVRVGDPRRIGVASHHGDTREDVASLRERPGQARKRTHGRACHRPLRLGDDARGFRAPELESRVVRLTRVGDARVPQLDLLAQHDPRTVVVGIDERNGDGPRRLGAEPEIEGGRLRHGDTSDRRRPRHCRPNR